MHTWQIGTAATAILLGSRRHEVLGHPLELKHTLQVAFGAYAEPLQKKEKFKSNTFKIALVASDCMLLGEQMSSGCSGCTVSYVQQAGCLCNSNTIHAGKHDTQEYYQL
jgi:hypothetical protein